MSISPVRLDERKNSLVAEGFSHTISRTHELDCASQFPSLPTNAKLDIRVMSAHVVLLRRGVLISDSLLSALMATFTEFDQVGMVGPRLFTRNGGVGNLSAEKVGDARERCEELRVPQVDSYSDHTRQVDHLSLSCLLIDSEVWKKINWFNEIYPVGECNEITLSSRVRELGYKCVYVPSIIVECDTEVCGETLRRLGPGSNFEINHLKLKARWYRPQRGQDNAGAGCGLNRIGHNINRILFLDFETPQPDTNAGGYAAIKEMQMLQSLGYQITFAPRNIELRNANTDALQCMGIECIYAPLYTDMDEFLSKRGADFSLIYVTRYHVAQDILPRLRRYTPTAKIILMLADLHFLRELRAALHNNDDEQLSIAIETRENELAVMRKVDLVLSYTDVEKTVILSHNLASTKVAKCPWMCDVVKCVSGFENRVDIAFLGGFNHSPNVEAMVWFIDRVWPTLVEQLPELHLRIYGSAVPQSIKHLATSNSRIQVHGWVSDVASVYNNCRVFIAPLQSGAGIKGKVIGALAHGVPSVLSDIAVEGIGVCDEVHAFVASSPDEWVNRIMMLYTDQAVWEQMSQHALNFAKRHYSLDNAIVKMKAALSTAGIEPILEPKALVWKGPWRSVAQV
jgi:glycosyltransferase involved in cell wall biosynthesis